VLLVLRIQFLHVLEVFELVLLGHQEVAGEVVALLHLMAEEVAVAEQEVLVEAAAVQLQLVLLVQHLQQSIPLFQRGMR
jgi:hypothetical protein